MYRVFAFAIIVIKQYIDWMIPDPFKYEMKKNPPKAETPAMPAQSAKAFIEGLPLDALCDIALERLSEALQMANPATDASLILKIYAELKDRKDGKPGQQVTIDQNLNVVTVNAQISFIKPDMVLAGQSISGNEVQVIEN